MIITKQTILSGCYGKKRKLVALGIKKEKETVQLKQYYKAIVLKYSKNRKARGSRTARGSDYSPAIVLSEEKDKLVTENWRDRKKKNRTNKYEQPDSSIHDTLTDSSFFNWLCLTVPEKNVMKNFNF